MGLICAKCAKRYLGLVQNNGFAHFWLMIDSWVMGVVVGGFQLDKTGQVCKT